jgi:uncharacterized protein (PEP-CTERM system associated)
MPARSDAPYRYPRCRNVLRTGSSRRDKYWSSAVVLLALGHATDALAADWVVQPRVQVRETYTDNLRLAPKGSEESDFVTEVEPGISIRAHSARLQLEADYALQYRIYADHGSANGHNNTLRSNALLDVWDRRLFLQASAHMAQQNISPLGEQSQSNVNLTGNRTEVRQANISPFWASRLSTWGSLEARYTWTRTEETGQASALDTETQATSLNLRSGPAFSVLAWSGAYSRQDIESTGGEFPERTIETIAANIQYKLLPTFALVATIGYDDNTYGSTRGSTSGRFWNAGANWAPSTRTHLHATFGERYFGNTYSLDAAHRTRLTTWTLNYSEEIVATPSRFDRPASFDTAASLDRVLLASVPDPIARQQAVQGLMGTLGLPSTLAGSVDFLTNEVSLSKRLLGSFGLRGRRGTALVTIFRDDRSNENSGSTTSAFGTDPFLVTDNIVQTGYSAIATWRFSERTAGSISHSLANNRYSDLDREDTINTFRIGVTHQLQPKLHGGLDLRITDRNSTISSESYRENAVIGTLTFLF